MSNVNNEYERNYIRRAIASHHEHLLTYVEEESQQDADDEVRSLTEQREAALAYFQLVDDARHPLLAQCRKAAEAAERGEGGVDAKVEDLADQIYSALFSDYVFVAKHPADQEASDALTKIFRHQQVGKIREVFTKLEGGIKWR